MTREVAALLAEVAAHPARLLLNAQGQVAVRHRVSKPLSDDLKARLRAAWQVHRRELTLAAVGADVRWRVLALLSDPSPAPCARGGAWPAERGRCRCCGDRFEPGRARRCLPCRLAARVVAKLGRDRGAPCVP